MKKNIVLFSLFILPIVAYLFFASGVNSFMKLPVITQKVQDFGNWKTLNGTTISLNGKITVVGFGGYDILKNRGNLFNLNQMIFQRYQKFTDLQFVIICPPGTEKDARYIMQQFAAFTGGSNWYFVFAPEPEINKFHASLKLQDQLSPDFGSSKVYIIDKERNLRGRKDEEEYKEGYDTFHPSELNNKMLDDFKIILYEYRAALRKNKNKVKGISKNEE